MARFFGLIGYGETVEKRPGVWVDTIVEYEAYGDVLRNSRQLRQGDKVNDDISVGNSISIMADAYAREHFFAMRYVRWAGTLWIVDDVVVESPRLILRLGGVYNGPTAEAPRDS
ncbi:MAG: hypothetical protein JWO15_3641 [Sphingomonadales bacterium]|nr:hypothetical protein [Sphingomonadales bacterium]